MCLQQTRRDTGISELYTYDMLVGTRTRPHARHRALLRVQDSSIAPGVQLECDTTVSTNVLNISYHTEILLASFLRIFVILSHSSQKAHQQQSSRRLRYAAETISPSDEKLPNPRRARAVLGAVTGRARPAPKEAGKVVGCPSTSAGAIYCLPHFL